MPSQPDDHRSTGPARPAGEGRIARTARRAILAVCVVAGPACADGLADFFDVMSRRIPCSETTSYDWLRLRNEHVSTSTATADRAEATTARLLLGLETRRSEAWSCSDPDPAAPRPGPGWRDFSFGVEGIAVIPVGGRTYRDQRTDTTSPYALINDPSYVDFNQLYAQHTLGVTGLDVRVGRQKIALDNERFIGASEFRQIMQVYDSATGTWTRPIGTDTLKLFGGYLARVRNSNGDLERTRTWLANARYDFRKAATFTAYWYGQGQPQSGQIDTRLHDASNQIAGGRVDVALPLRQNAPRAQAWEDDVGPILRANVELAQQRPFADGDDSIRAGYRDIGIGVTRPLRGLWRLLTGSDGPFPGLQETLRLAQQVRSSNNGLYGFRMPLGTGHAFQGADDIFLETPAIGLRDTLVGFSMARNNWTAGLEHHKFASDFGASDLGHEDDLSLSYTLLPHREGWNEVELRIDYARYHEGDHAALFSVANGSTVDPFAHSTRKLFFTATLRW